MGFNQQLFNVVMLGVGFQLVFSAFNPTQTLQILVLQDARNQSNGTFHANGYTSLAIVYGCLASANWVAPVVVSRLGPRVTMSVAALSYALYCASFISPTTWSVYLMSVLLGIGGAMLWTAQAVYLSQNSSANTATRNSGIFMTLLSISSICGFLISFFFLKGKSNISQDTRTLLFIVFGSICALGVIVFALLPSPRGRILCCSLHRRRQRKKMPEPTAQERACINAESPDQSSVNLEKNGEILKVKSSDQMSYCQVFLKTCRLAVTLEVLPIHAMAFFSGMAMTIASVFPTCVGNTLAFGAFSKAAVSLCGVCVTAGMILASLLVTAVGRSRFRLRHDLVVIFGFFLIVTSLTLMFLFTPATAPFEPSSGSILEPKLFVAFICSVLLGWGHFCFDTELLAFSCHFFKDDAAPIYSLFKSGQSITGAVSFAYSRRLAFPWQLLIAGVTCLVAVISFYLLQRTMTSRRLEVEAKE